MVKKWPIFLGILTTLVHLSVKAAVFTASVDREQLITNEKLTLTLSLSNSDTRLRAEGINPNIDLSVLNEHFDVGMPEADYRYNVYQGRGRSTSELKIELYPKGIGKFKIPSFTTDNAQTKPITIEVKTGDSSFSPEVFIRKGSNLTTLWEGQQLVAFIDIYHRVKLKQAHMTDTLETEPTRIELLPHWKLPQEKFQTEHNGFNYNVQRLAWALFPDKAGTISTYLPSIEVTTESNTELRFSHQKIDISVKSLPTGIPKDIIIGVPEISFSKLPTRVENNVLTNWTVTVKAPVAVSTLPNYLPGLPKQIEGFKIYQDRAIRDTFKSSSGIIDQAEYAISVMPQKEGELSFNAIDIPYFDPETGTAKLFEIEEQKFNSLGTTKNSALNLKAPNEAQRVSNHITPHTDAIFWQTTTLLIAFLWLVSLSYTTVLIRRTRNNNSTKEQSKQPESTQAATNKDPTKQKLLEVLGSKTLEEGLSKWQSTRLNNNEIRNAIKQVQIQYYAAEGKIDEAQLKQLIETIEETAKRKTEKIITGQKKQWLSEAFSTQKQ